MRRIGVLERDHGYTLIGIPYDRPVVGYGGETVNTLRLWSAVAPDGRGGRGGEPPPLRTDGTAGCGESRVVCGGDMGSQRLPGAPRLARTTRAMK